MDLGRWTVATTTRALLAVVGLDEGSPSKGRRISRYPADLIVQGAKDGSSAKGSGVYSAMEDCVCAQ